MGMHVGICSSDWSAMLQGRQDPWAAAPLSGIQRKLCSCPSAFLPEGEVLILVPREHRLLNMSRVVSTYH